MPSSNSVWVSALCGVLGTGCVTPQYTIRPTPVPEESAEALQIERTISAVQAKDFARQGARLVNPDERLWGFPIHAMIERLSRVTERPALRYRAYLYREKDPNAAALADGRIYLSTGLLNYLAGRGGREDELAFIVSHELAHTSAQHLVKRYRYLQQQQLLLSVAAAGIAAATGGASAGAQEAGRMALDVASLLQDVANSGYSQEQELEADQLGIQYVRRAGFDPRAALDLLKDFTRFDAPWPFLRTHPYIERRRQDLERYLRDAGALSSPSPPVERSAGSKDARCARLRSALQQYPVGSQSWKNLTQQLAGEGCK